tara:strand:- start:708 stop:1637 length:930 start_codon:yes stop_codon:yes gene_type:complete
MLIIKNSKYLIKAIFSKFTFYKIYQGYKYIKFSIYYLKNKKKINFYTSSYNPEKILPKVIHVETRTLCSGKCTFCAANIMNTSRSDDLMHMELVDKLISELSDLNYKGRLSFYNNNEPFLDKRILSIVGKAREKVSNCFLELKSNGKSLKIETVDNIFKSGLDYLYVNDYLQREDYKNKKFSKNVQILFENINNHYPHLKKKISFIHRLEDQILNSRAGTSPNQNSENLNYNWRCFRPFEMMTLSPSGDVAMCSDDVYYDEVMGNFKESKLIDIWTSEKYKKNRELLINKKRNLINTCKNCDYVGYTLN